jgi:uncharacterized protein YodC (DUF2158 family)
MEFQLGDVVRLKSGGPLMTVARVGDYDITCQWFTSDAAAASVMESFISAVIEKVE